jgi:hypothetical protein
MKTMRERLKARLHKDRPSSQVTVVLPDDVIADLTEIAPALGFSSHHSLIRTYIGEGLRKDLEKLDGSSGIRLTESLRQQPLSDNVISDAIVEADLKRA